jgi:PhnB protein
MNGPDGKIAHAEMRIGGAMIMLSDESPQWEARSPTTIGDTPISIMLYVDDVDTVYKRAIAAGATSTMEVADQFYGDRAGGIKDPFGHKWHIATHVEDVDPQELEARAQKLFAEKK